MFGVVYFSLLFASIIFSRNLATETDAEQYRDDESPSSIMDASFLTDLTTGTEHGGRILLSHPSLFYRYKFSIIAIFIIYYLVFII